MNGVTQLIIIGAVMFALIGFVTMWSNLYSLNSIKNKKVGHGQHGNARFATEKEVKKIYQLCRMSQRNGGSRKAIRRCRRERLWVQDDVAGSCMRWWIPGTFTR